MLHTNYALQFSQFHFFQAKLVGRALCEANIAPEQIYCSPAYRCVQTGQGIVSGYTEKNRRPMLVVEPGLYEWGEQLFAYWKPFSWKMNSSKDIVDATRYGGYRSGTRYGIFLKRYGLPLGFSYLYISITEPYQPVFSNPNVYSRMC